MTSPLFSSILEAYGPIRSISRNCVPDRRTGTNLREGAESLMTCIRSKPPERVYVKVNSDFDATGAVTPRSITWKDGRTFKIESVRDYRPASTLGPGRSGDCYTVLIHGEEKHLFFQKTEQRYDCRVGRWWVEIEAG